MPSEMVLVFLFCFLFAFVVGHFCPAQIPSHNAVMPRMQPLPFEELLLKVQRCLSAKALGSVVWKVLRSAMFDEDVKCCSCGLSR